MKFFTTAGVRVERPLRRLLRAARWLPALLPLTAHAQLGYGGPPDVAFAAVLWQHLSDARLVGVNAFESKAYSGRHPHGPLVQVLYTSADLGGGRGELIVLRSYAGAGVSAQRVAEEPARYLQGIDVMYRRPGYNPAANDWFWSSYRPDGSLRLDARGALLSGRIGQRSAFGCIGCHAGAPGADGVYSR